MRRLLAALPVVAALALAPSAFAGGWATVGLSSTPAGTAPGTPWNVELTILQHGRTPLDGLSPTITIRNGDAAKTFAATPAGKPGVYRAAVVFPTAGKWTYEVNDGFIADQVHTFPAVEIGAPAPAAAATASDGGGVNWLAVAGVAMLLAALALIVWDRARRRPQQPQAA